MINFLTSVINAVQACIPRMAKSLPCTGMFMCLCTVPVRALLGSEQDGCDDQARAALGWHCGFKLLHAVSDELLQWQPVWVTSDSVAHILMCKSSQGGVATTGHTC